MPEKKQCEKACHALSERCGCSQPHCVDFLDEVSLEKQATGMCRTAPQCTDHEESPARLLDLQADADAADVQQRAEAINPLPHKVWRCNSKVNGIGQTVFAFNSHVEYAVLCTTYTRALQNIRVGRRSAGL